MVLHKLHSISVNTVHEVHYSMPKLHYVAKISYIIPHFTVLAWVIVKIICLNTRQSPLERPCFLLKIPTIKPLLSSQHIPPMRLPRKPNAVHFMSPTTICIAPGNMLFRHQPEFIAIGFPSDSAYADFPTMLYEIPNNNQTPRSPFPIPFDHILLHPQLHDLRDPKPTLRSFPLRGQHLGPLRFRHVFFQRWIIDHVDTRIEISKHSPYPFLVRLVDSFLPPLPPETTSLQRRPLWCNSRLPNIRTPADNILSNFRWNLPCV